MDFTVLPNEREMAELRNLVSGIDTETEARSERQLAPIACATSRHITRTGHAVDGESHIGQRAARRRLGEHFEPQSVMEG